MNNGSEKPNIKSPGRKLFWVLLLVPIIIYFIFGLQHIAKFETADEHYWIYSNTNNNDYWENDNGRIHQYWDALLSGNWKKTRINDKPGVTLAYVAGIGSRLKTGLDKAISSGQIPAMSKADKAEVINWYFRLPILIFNALFSLVIFYLIRKLTESGWIALISASLILLSPVIVGVSQIVNPDALLWEFGFAAILSFLVFLRSGAGRFAALAALFLGFSLLTKYSSVILMPFFFAVMLFWFVENISAWNGEQASKKIMRYALAYLAIVAGGLLVYAVMLPDNLVQFRHFMKGSIGFAGLQWLFGLIFGLDLAIIADAHFLKSRTLAAIGQNSSLAYKYFKKAVFLALPAVAAVVVANAVFPNDPLYLFVSPFDSSNKSIFSSLPQWRIILKQFMPFIFSLTPLVLAGLAYAWLKETARPSKHEWTVFVLSFFMLVFVAASMQQEQMLTIRYSMMLYPAAALIAGIGIHRAISFVKRGKIFKLVAFTAAIALSLISLWGAKPFYFNYTSFLLPQKYLITDAWGYGGYEAAQYLNGIPGAEQSRIWADYNGTCLFFNGKCESNNLTMKNIRKKSESLPRFEYFVSSRRGKILARGLWKKLPGEYQAEEVWSMVIGGRPENSITVYENKIYKN